MRARRSARVAARTCVGGDPTNALFILHICASIVRGAISFRDLLYVSLHESVRTIERIARCLPQARCLCNENGAIGFKLKYCTFVMYDQLYIYYANYDEFECHSVKRPPRYNSQLYLAPR